MMDLMTGVTEGKNVVDCKPYRLKALVSVVGLSEGKKVVD